MRLNFIQQEHEKQLADKNGKKSSDGDSRSSSSIQLSNEERHEETAMLEKATADLLGENDNTSGTFGSEAQNSKISLIKKKLFWPELEQAQTRFDQKLKISMDQMKKEILESM